MFCQPLQQFRKGHSTVGRDCFADFGFSDEKTLSNYEKRVYRVYHGHKTMTWMPKPRAQTTCFDDQFRPCWQLAG
eukprot:5810114-Amphidinium_carterae.1